MPLAGDERRLRDSGEREDRRRVSVKTTCPPRPPLLPRPLTDKSTGSIWIGGHSACFCPNPNETTKLCRSNCRRVCVLVSNRWLFINKEDQIPRKMPCLFCSWLVSRKTAREKKEKKKKKSGIRNNGPVRPSFEGPADTILNLVLNYRRCDG